jgi:hypothetical protein
VETACTKESVVHARDILKFDGMFPGAQIRPEEQEAWNRLFARAFDLIRKSAASDRGHCNPGGRVKRDQVLTVICVSVAPGIDGRA